MDNPLVSIYITSCNYENYIKDAIESALNQSYQNIEIIVFDDNSSDNSIAIINEYKDNPKIKLFFSKESNGLRRSSNHCIRSSKGKYVMRLDADDVLHENCIELMIRNIVNSDNKPQFIFSNYFYINDLGELLGSEIIHKDNGNYEAHSLPPHGACCLIKKEIFEKFGYYDESIKRQDGHEIWIKILNIL